MDSTVFANDGTTSESSASRRLRETVLPTLPQSDTVQPSIEADIVALDESSWRIDDPATNAHLPVPVSSLSPTYVLVEAVVEKSAFADDGIENQIELSHAESLVAMNAVVVAPPRHTALPSASDAILLPLTVPILQYTRKPFCKPKLFSRRYDLHMAPKFKSSLVARNHS
jgi:hypothetical protein